MRALPAVHGVVIVVPEVQAALLVRHQGGVGIGHAGLEVGAAPIPVSDDGSIGCAVAGQPVVAFFIGVGKVSLAFGVGDREGVRWVGSRPPRTRCRRQDPHR